LIGIFVLLFKWRSGNEKLHYKNIIAGIFLGLLNWYSTYYFIKGIDIFEVTVFIPAFNTGVVTLASLIGFWFFKEKLSFYNKLGVFLAIVAIVFLAI